MGSLQQDTTALSVNSEEEKTYGQPDLEKQLTNKTTTSTDLNETLYPETDLDRGIVGWDGQDDPANPQNFAASKKWSLLGLISAFTLISPLASSMFAPAVVYMGEDFGETNETILAFSVSIFLIGYTVSLCPAPYLIFEEDLSDNSSLN